MTILIHSGILIEASRGRDKGVLAQWLHLGQSDALILFSAISAAELWAGARPSEYGVLGTLIGALVCVPVDAAGERGIICGDTERAKASS